MLLDVLAEAHRYYPLQPRLQAGFEYLRSTDLQSLPLGKHAIDGDHLFVIVAEDEGRGTAGARLEAHRKYADIQTVVFGSDLIGWRPASACAQISEAYDESRDVMFYAEQPSCWVPLLPGWFSVFYPADPHAPLAGQGVVRKAVVKVLLD